MIDKTKMTSRQSAERYAQELMGEIESLETKNEALTERLQELEAELARQEAGERAKQVVMGAADSESAEERKARIEAIVKETLGVSS